MSRLNDLLRQLGTTNPALAADLQREVAALADRRAFGLNFERHMPEAVELPGRPVRKGDKVRILPPRGENRTVDNDRLWRVARIDRSASTERALVTALEDEEMTAKPITDDLVVVAEFRDPIYPGLVSTGKVERGGEKPFHTVINAENYHALEALLFTHRGKVDCIYIDPPYNSGARDWKYNNDYVEREDLYRHSKWLAFMERRLQLAKELLKSDDSVLIVTIDEKEYLRLGILLEQEFPHARMQMISTTINPKGSARGSDFYRVDEYIFVLFLGSSSVAPLQIAGLCVTSDESDQVAESIPVRWGALLRSGTNARRNERPNLYYPIYVDTQRLTIEGFGPAIPIGQGDRATPQDGQVAIWPRRSDGSDGRWQLSGQALMALAERGLAKLTSLNEKTGRGVVMYTPSGVLNQIESGEVRIAGVDERGVAELEYATQVERSARPKTQWTRKSHSASDFGTSLLKLLLPGRTFPFPKSLYAVEDTLRFFLAQKSEATVLDFFSGSGTTAHAVMRLNKHDGGTRQSISITNNEVSADEQGVLRERGLRPGDVKWEIQGICDYITKPRIEAAITGKTPEGDPISGDYKFMDEFPMKDGLEENVEFFTLTYESPLRLASNRDFERIAPLLWLRAGARGRRIDDVSKGWDVTEAYGVLANLDKVEGFLSALSDAPRATVAFILTDEDRLFETIVRDLPESVEPVRLYEAYLRNFEIEAGRSLR